MTTYTSQPDETSGIDATIDYASQNANDATGATLVIGEADDAVGAIKRALIKFDLSTIPAAAQVSSATLYLTQTSEKASNARSLRVYRLLKNWVEAQVTWNEYSTGNAWTNDLGGFDPADCEQTDIGNISLSATEANGEKTITLTASKVQEWISGVLANYGLLVKMDTESNDRHIFASSSDATSTNRPKLVIEYTVTGETYSCIWTSG